MENSVPQKIHIIGSVGSGKSTLARNLSSRLDIPYYELDNVVWIRTPHGDVRNKQRDEQFHNIISSNVWIVEGVHHTWVSKGFEQADIIIYLDTPIWQRNYRILKRFIIQKLGLEKGNYKQTFEMLRKMYKWNYSYEKENKPEILEILKPHKEKLIMLHDNKDIQKIIR